MIIQRVPNIFVQGSDSAMTEISKGKSARNGLIGLKHANPGMKCFIAVTCPKWLRDRLAMRGIKTAYELPMGSRALGQMCGRDHGVSVVSIP